MWVGPPVHSVAWYMVLVRRPHPCQTLLFLAHRASKHMYSTNNVEGVGKAGGGELGPALGGIPRLLRALPTTHVQPCMGSALEMAGLSTQAGESWQMGKGYCPKPVPSRGGGEVGTGR